MPASAAAASGSVGAGGPTVRAGCCRDVGRAGNTGGVEAAAGRTDSSAPSMPGMAGRMRHNAATSRLPGILGARRRAARELYMTSGGHGRIRPDDARDMGFLRSQETPILGGAIVLGAHGAWRAGPCVEPEAGK